MRSERGRAVLISGLAVPAFAAFEIGSALASRKHHRPLRSATPGAKGTTVNGTLYVDRFDNRDNISGEIVGGPLRVHDRR